MEVIMDNTKNLNEPLESQLVENSKIEPNSMSSVTLARLVEEVRNNGDGGSASATAYNRTYHRHNR